MNNLRKILPYILATLTQSPRYLPEIKWSNKSWSYNLFRAYEFIFWRRQGIRAESATFQKSIRVYGRNKNVFVRELYTTEALACHLEVCLRKYLSGEIKFELPYKLYMPVMLADTGRGTTLKISPYVFAIAFDTKTGMTTGVSATVTSASHTCSGSDPILWSGVTIRNTRTITVTPVYNLGSMTQSGSTSGTSGITNYLYYLGNPTTGVGGTVVSTQSASDNFATATISFSGASSTGIPDANGVGGPTAIGAGYSQSVTSVADNCFAVMYGDNNSGAALTGGANTTIGNQPEVAFTGAFLAYSTAAKTPAGTFTLAFTSASGTAATCMASFKPPGASSAIKTVDGLAIASVKTVLGLAIASVKNIDGLA